MHAMEILVNLCAILQYKWGLIEQKFIRLTKNLQKKRKSSKKSFKNRPKIAQNCSKSLLVKIVRVSRL